MKDAFYGHTIHLLTMAHIMCVYNKCYTNIYICIYIYIYTHILNIYTYVYIYIGR